MVEVPFDLPPVRCGSHRWGGAIVHTLRRLPPEILTAFHSPVCEPCPPGLPMPTNRPHRISYTSPASRLHDSVYCAASVHTLIYIPIHLIVHVLVQEVVFNACRQLGAVPCGCRRSPLAPCRDQPHSDRCLPCSYLAPTLQLGNFVPAVRSDVAGCITRQLQLLSALVHSTENRLLHPCMEAERLPLGPQP